MTLKDGAVVFICVFYVSMLFPLLIGTALMALHLVERYREVFSKRHGDERP